MRTLRYTLFGLALLTVSLSSCKKEQFSSEFDQSLKTWEQFKSSANNNYSYVAVEVPANFTYTETRLVLKNGQVEARDFYLYEYKLQVTPVPTN